MSTARLRTQLISAVRRPYTGAKTGHEAWSGLAIAALRYFKMRTVRVAQEDRADHPAKWKSAFA
ncbi:hypothetical protein DVT68_00440 [Dyella solisilvae]|uniref:Uncharacterized protein n=1 Tax=Dyella solisilvae TaxID=1920168 RepID=A0A370KAA6_9GAMM|nr:hypothetical protein DVT68_00440 [Dyella solisilvae]